MKLLRGKRGVFSIMACLVMLSIIVSACGSANTGNGNPSPTSTSPFTKAKGCKKVGVALPETNTSFRWDRYDRPQLISNISSALGIPTSNIIVENAQQSAQTQQTQADSMIAQGACILVVGAADSTAAGTIVSNAKAKGIPVVAYDRLINNKDTAAYVSFQNDVVGQLQGQYIADHYQDYVTKAGNNNLVIINGAQTDNNAILFKSGMHSVVDPLVSSNKLKATYEQFTDWTAKVAQQDFEAALTTNQNKVAVAYVANDDMANSVISSLKQVHLNGKVLVTGQDAALVAMTNILKGDQAMTVYKNYGLEAEATAKVVAALAKGDDISTVATQSTKDANGDSIPSLLETPVAVDKSNLKDTILKDNFYTKAEICQGIPAGTDGIC
jgi:D-xylose transport system substrate-binding protein